MENRTIYSLKKRLAAFGMCIAMVCTMLLAGATEAKAGGTMEWECFTVKVTAVGKVKARKKAKFKVTVQNVRKKSLKLAGLEAWYYREMETGKYPCVAFGKFTDKRGKVVAEGTKVFRKVTFKAGEKKTFFLTGTMPKTWSNRGEISIGVTGKAKNNIYLGQGGYRTKKATVKGTSLTRVTPGKEQVTVRWKGIKYAGGFQIQYATNKSFKGAKKIIPDDINKHTIKGLESGKKYYVRIRTFLEGNPGSNTNTAYSRWSVAKAVKIK